MRLGQTLISILLTIGKFIYGFIFGALIWSIVVHPYLAYYDFTYGSYGPMCLFASVVAFIFLRSLWVRSLMVLYLPSMVGGAAQNYIIMLLFSAVFLNPVTNIGLNAIESVRVIGCSLTMTFDQLRERAKLVLNPIAEVLTDKNQTALDPIRKNLFEIQQFIGKLQRNINLAALQTSRQTDDSVPKPDQSAGGQKTNAKALGGDNKAVDIRQSSSSSSSPKMIKDDQIDFEWDLENFGIKATIDVDQLRALAKQGRLRRLLLKGNETLSGGQVNITDILYDSCVGMFQSAKGRCSEAVEDMHGACKDKLGPFLATWWCDPFTYSLDKFCPAIMAQLVNENNVCKELKMSQLAHLEKGRKFIKGAEEGTKYKDLNEAFRELTQQVGKLNENILAMDDADGADNAGGNSDTHNGDRLRRFELSLTFNEKTRRVFQDIKQLIQFISDKYKLRRLFIDLLYLVYDIYTTYTFALILWQAWRYRRDYLANIKFDNCYITNEFVELDKQWHERQKFAVARNKSQTDSLAKTVRSSLDEQANEQANDEEDKVVGNSKEKDKDRMVVAPVLPLTRDESQRYLRLFTCFQRTKEERRIQRGSLWTLAMFLFISLSILYLDNIFHSILTSIQEHSLIRYKEVGHHELDIKVYGDGVIARLVKRLVGSFSSAYKLNRLTSTQKCLPNARHTSSVFYWNFFALLSGYFLIDQLAIYAKRLRPVTCAFFYPDRERSRLKYLHRFIRFQRRNLAKTGVKNYLVFSDDGSAAGSIGGGGQEGERKFQEDLDEEAEADKEGAFSLAEACVYLRQCLARSSQKYCSCWNRLLFARPRPLVDDDNEKSAFKRIANDNKPSASVKVPP